VAAAGVRPKASEETEDKTAVSAEDARDDIQSVIDDEDINAADTVGEIKSILEDVKAGDDDSLDEIKSMLEGDEPAGEDEDAEEVAQSALDEVSTMLAGEEVEEEEVEEGDEEGGGGGKKAEADDKPAARRAAARQSRIAAARSRTERQARRAGVKTAEGGGAVGVKDDRILSCSEADGRQKLALELYRGGSSLASARRALKASPKAEGGGRPQPKDHKVAASGGAAADADGVRDKSLVASAEKRAEAASKNRR